MLKFPANMQNDSFRMWNREQTKALIQEYSQNECLWNTTSPIYRHRQKRIEALQYIADSLGSYRPQTSAEDVKNKINGIRTQYVSEINKLIVGSKNGEEYTPTLWCFDILNFLKPHTQPKHKPKDWARSSSIKSYGSSTASKVQSLLLQQQHMNTSKTSAPERPQNHNSTTIKAEPDEDNDDIEIIEEDAWQSDIESSNQSSLHTDPLKEDQRINIQELTWSLNSGSNNAKKNREETEEQKLQRIFSPTHSNPEVTLVPKRDFVKKRSIDELQEVEEKRSKMDVKLEPKGEENDRINIFGKFVMSQLRTIVSPLLLMKLEHTIQNAIIETQLKQVELEDKNTQEECSGK